MGWSAQQFFVSKRVSGLLRGHNHANRRDRIPLPDFQDGAWMDFASVFSFIKRRYSRSLTVSDLIDIVTSNHRFMLDVQLAREGELFAGKYLFLPARIKAIQSHNDWILENINMPLASEKLLFFSLLQKVVCQPVFLASRFFMLEASGSQKKASRNPKKRLLEAKKRGF